MSQYERPHESDTRHQLPVSSSLSLARAQHCEIALKPDYCGYLTLIILSIIFSFIAVYGLELTVYDMRVRIFTWIFLIVHFVFLLLAGIYNPYLQNDQIHDENNPQRRPLVACVREILMRNKGGRNSQMLQSIIAEDAHWPYHIYYFIGPIFLTYFLVVLFYSLSAYFYNHFHPK